MEACLVFQVSNGLSHAPPPYRIPHTNNDPKPKQPTTLRQRLADRGRERCTLDMIWAEYEAFLRQEPLLPCRYSRPVFHKVCGRLWPFVL